MREKTAHSMVYLLNILVEVLGLFSDSSLEGNSGTVNPHSFFNTNLCKTLFMICPQYSFYFSVSQQHWVFLSGLLPSPPPLCLAEQSMHMYEHME